MIRTGIRTIIQPKARHILISDKDIKKFVHTLRMMTQISQSKIVELALWLNKNAAYKVAVLLHGIFGINNHQNHSYEFEMHLQHISSQIDAEPPQSCHWKILLHWQRTFLFI